MHLFGHTFDHDYYFELPRNRRQEIWNRIRSATRAAKKLYWPFGAALFLDVTIVAGIGFVNVFKLSNRRVQCVGTCCLAEKCYRFSVGREGMVTVAALLKVGRTTLWVAPHA